VTSEFTILPFSHSFFHSFIFRFILSFFRSFCHSFILALILSFISDSLTYHKQNTSLTINNGWIDIYWKLEYQSLTWMNEVRIIANSSSIPTVNQWPLITITPKSLSDTKQSITRLYDVDSHDQNEVKFNLIENLSFNLYQKFELIDLNSILCHSSFLKYLLPITILSFESNHNSRELINWLIDWWLMIDDWWLMIDDWLSFHNHFKRYSKNELWLANMIWQMMNGEKLKWNVSMFILNESWSNKFWIILNLTWFWLRFQFWFWSWWIRWRHLI
jgi:hypothetical protein